MNKIASTTVTVTSVIPIAMLCIGFGILMVPPIVLGALSLYSPDNKTVIEEAMDSTLIASTLPALSIVLLILGLIGLGLHGLLKKYYLATSSKHMNR